MAPLSPWVINPAPKLVKGATSGGGKAEDSSHRTGILHPLPLGVRGGDTEARQRAGIAGGQIHGRGVHRSQ